MATVIHLEDLQNGYVDLVNRVITEGHYSNPRGMGTIELEDVMLIISDLHATVPTLVGRKPNLMIAALEALQLISGHATPNLIVAASPPFAQFREYDGQFWGSYGDRIRNQVRHIVRKLQTDHDSRQAVLTLWDPDLDNTPGMKDYPCTVAMGFRIRNDALNMSVTMRSNDIWLGTTYDVFQFTQLQSTIANVLEIEVGTYTHNAWSFHIYERDLDKIDELFYKDNDATSYIPDGLPSFGIARDILDRPADFVSYDNPAIRWYADLALRAHQKLSTG